jgi:NADP-dependent 3-hydroxy acid dehydrogenase YdfG
MNKKICLITGANSGIGKAASIHFAKKGYDIIMGCRNLERSENALKDIKNISKSNNINLIIMDMSSMKSIKYAVDKIENNYNHIDILIHNAAYFDISKKNP